MCKLILTFKKNISTILTQMMARRDEIEAMGAEEEQDKFRETEK